MTESRTARQHRHLEALELELLLKAVADYYGYDFRQYSPASLGRRVRHAMSEEGVRTLSALQDRVLHDEAAMVRFVEALSVHVTSMFRDPDFYRAVRKQVVPLLRTYPFIRIWHAGCSTGEEVYSLAILFVEEGVYDRCRIYATDMSDGLLERARRGVFSLANMREYTSNYQQAGGRSEFSSYYTASHESAIFRDSLRRNLIFSQHNLATDSAFNEFNLVMCRNVMIYFDRPLRERVHELLYESLVRFGILALGKKESISASPYADLYEIVDSDVRLFRRVA